jgi:hypothetical protein
MDLSFSQGVSHRCTRDLHSSSLPMHGFVASRLRAAVLSIWLRLEFANRKILEECLPAPLFLLRQVEGEDRTRVSRHPFIAWL